MKKIILFCSTLLFLNGLLMSQSDPKYYRTTYLDGPNIGCLTGSWHLVFSDEFNVGLQLEDHGI